MVAYSLLFDRTGADQLACLLAQFVRRAVSQDEAAVW